MRPHHRMLKRGRKANVETFGSEDRQSSNDAVTDEIKKMLELIYNREDKNQEIEDERN